MSILDDAIREHLELKRQHGADESELKRLEDEAFGPPSRPEEPDPLAEAPTEFMTAEGADAVEPDAEGGRRINVADLQEPPPAPEEPKVEAVETVEPEADAPPAPPAEDAAQAAPPAEEPLAAEEPAADERQAIAEQPTEFFDVEAEMGTEDAPAPPATEAPSPSDEQIAEAEAGEPKLAPVEPPTEIYASRTEALAEEPALEEEEDEEFWSDQRLSDELDQALEAPVEPEPVEPPPPAPAPAAEDDLDDDEHEAPAGEQPNYDPDTGHEDVLEDTPDFLEDAPEDDELWFEQRPPKDFDFDD